MATTVLETIDAPNFVKNILCFFVKLYLNLHVLDLQSQIPLVFKFSKPSFKKGRLNLTSRHQRDVMEKAIYSFDAS